MQYNKNFNTMLISNPLEQFEVSLLLPFELIFNFSISSTHHLTAYLIINTILTSFFCILITSNLKIFPSCSWQLFFEKAYMALMMLFYETLEDNGRKFFPVLTTLFLLILISNLTGLVPYSFTATSHIISTYTLSSAFFIGISIISTMINVNGVSALSLFLPPGVPLILTPLLLYIFIEIISYFIKVFTLAIRLFTNMTSGHTLLKVIASFCWSMIVKKGFISFFSLVPFVLLIILGIVELGVSFLQAYVFTLLVSIYLNDVLKLH
nr:Atp6 [Porphyridium purpureum]